MFLFIEYGQFIKYIGQCLIILLCVFVRSDGYMIIVFDFGDDLVKVFIFDGVGLVQFFRVLDCDVFLLYVVYYEDRFFVFFVVVNCVKVFNK